MVFELWEYEGGHTFFAPAADETAYRAQLRQLELDHGHAKRTWTVEANNYNEAMQMLYDRKGWGRYRTIEEDLGESADPSGLDQGGKPA